VKLSIARRTPSITKYVGVAPSTVYVDSGASAGRCPSDIVYSAATAPSGADPNNRAADAAGIKP
jgi:hypothetical protein